MNGKFINFLESIESVNPKLVGGILEAYELLFENYSKALEEFGEGSEETINQFRELVKRNQFQGNEKDINYWRKQGFESFKAKVLEVAEKVSKKKKEKDKSYTPHPDSKLVGSTTNYNVFEIPTYEAARFMGRFYKNKWSNWCISTDNCQYFKENYKDSDFFFLIRKEFQGDDFDKIALELEENGDITYWDVKDKSYDEDSPNIPDEVKQFTNNELKIPEEKVPIRNKLLLNRAIKSDDIEAVRKAIEVGAKPNDYTLTYALKSGNPEMVKLVVELGAKPDNRTLTNAIESGNPEITKLVVELGAKPDNRTLTNAIESGNSEMVKLALELGAKSGNRTLNYALKSGNPEIIKLVAELGAKPDDNTLYYAIESGNPEMVKLVVELGAKPNDYTLRHIRLNGTTPEIKELLGL